MTGPVLTFTLPASVPLCLACGSPIYAGGDIELEGEPDFDEIARAVTLEIAVREEEAIVAHYQSRHALRYRLFMLFGWKRLLGTRFAA